MRFVKLKEHCGIIVPKNETLTVRKKLELKSIIDGAAIPNSWRYK
jgi:hypothetical protein